MMSEVRKKDSRVAIACSTGGFKGVFLHGVLAAFEEAGFRAGAYTAASSSVMPAAFAAIGKTRVLGLEHWIDSLRFIAKEGRGMSELVLTGIKRASPTIAPLLFQAESPRFLIAANAVDSEGAQETQGTGARRLGRRLLLAAARGDRRWIDEHLTLILFDSKSSGKFPLLSSGNFEEVAYASSRMLHAWEIPAWIDGQAYVDAFYTCACPAYEAAELGYGLVLAISNEPVLYRDIFQSETIGSKHRSSLIQVIRPDIDPAEMGVSYTTGTMDGLSAVYEHGNEKGFSYMKSYLEDGLLAED
jgi:predicted acylesterase/phospholipase RssA